MANGKIILGKQSGGTLDLVFPDGVSDTEVILPESGELVTKNSPEFTGTPTAPTAAVATNNTQIATTAFVKSVVASSGSFTQSFSQNGWTKLPNGLIIQWGYSAAKTNILFPISFPNACLAVVEGYATASYAAITAISKTGFTFSNGALNLYYLAIGY